MFSLGRYEKQISELQDFLAERDDQIIKLQQENSDYKRTIAAFPGIKSDYDDKIAKLEASHKKKMEDLKFEYEAKLSSLTKENKQIKKSVATQVNIELASLGIPIMNAPKEDGITAEALSTECLAQLSNLSGNARTEYYKQNRSKIEQAMTSLQQLSK